MSTTYLLPALGGYLQVDTGYERDYSLYRAKLKTLGVPVGDIRYLILTHHHDDHAGFLNDLTRDTSLTIIAHEKAGELLKTGANDKSAAVDMLIRLLDTSQTPKCDSIHYGH